MNQKDFSKTAAIKNGVDYTARKVAPVYNRYYERLNAIAQKDPKRTAIAMLVFATVNVLIMVYIVNSRPSSNLISKNASAAISEIAHSKRTTSADFSLPNYFKISKLKDSLDYLMKLPRLSKTDSLLFIRICDQYSKLDPVFSKQVNEAFKKNKNPNHEKDNH